MEELVIEIDEKGGAKIAVTGCAGPSCKSLTASIEKALGSVSKDTLTEEYHARNEIGIVSKR